MTARKPDAGEDGDQRAATRRPHTKRDRIKRLRARAEAMPQITEQGSVARGIVLGMLDLLEDEL